MLPLILQTRLPWLGPLDVPSYFLLITIAFLVGTSLVVRDARREGFRVIDVLDLSLVLLAAGLIGARLGHIFFESAWITLPVPAQSSAGWQHFFCRMAGESHATTRPWNLGWYYLLHPQMVFAVWNGGMVFYGGFLLAFPSALWFCRRRKMDFWRTADLVAPIAAAGLAFGRVGCLLAGCCHGHPVSGPLSSLGIVLPSSGFGDTPIWPTQPFETLAAFAIAFALYRLKRIRTFDGEIFLGLVVLYGIWRPFNESLRGDGQRGIHLGLTTSQWISLGCILGALAIAPYLWRRRVRPAAAPARETVPSPAISAPTGA